MDGSGDTGFDACRRIRQVAWPARCRGDVDGCGLGRGGHAARRDRDNAGAAPHQTRAGSARGKLVGIVSRSKSDPGAGLIAGACLRAGAESDRKIRQELLDKLGREDWTDFGERNVIVSGGIVHLWGLVGSPQEHKALLALAEGVPGAASVSDETIPAY